MEDLAAHLRAMGLRHRRIGVEIDNYYFSAKAYRRPRRRNCPRPTLVDATGARELAARASSPTRRSPSCARRPASSKRSSTAIGASPEPGRPKNELVAEIFGAAIRGVGDAWGDYPAIVPLLPSGTDAAAPHLTWDGEPLQDRRGHLLRARRLLPPLSRAALPHGLPRQAAAGPARRREGADARGAGGRARRRAGRQPRRRHRQRLVRRRSNGSESSKDSRCGYPIGISYPPDWGERTISSARRTRRCSEPGMTFHFMPGLWIGPTGGSRHRDHPDPRDGPAETFCTVERKLFVKD